MPRKLKIVEAPEIVYQWRSGFHPPKADVNAVKAAIDVLPEPNPENLYEASKKASHILHEALWEEGDQVWAKRARVEYCRRVISNIVEPINVGGKVIEVRTFEFVKTSDGNDRWSSIRDIMSNKELRDAYGDAIEALQLEAAAKFGRFNELLKQIK